MRVKQKEFTATFDEYPRVQMGYLYIRPQETAVEKTVTVGDINLDFDDSGRLVGIEFMNSEEAKAVCDDT